MSLQGGGVNTLNVFGGWNPLKKKNSKVNSIALCRYMSAGKIEVITSCRDRMMPKHEKKKSK